MPESFLEQQARTHNVKPMVNARRVDRRNFNHSVTNGVGVDSGFKLSLTTPVSSSVWVTRGLATGPDGEQIRFATDPKLSTQNYVKAQTALTSLFDAALNLESLTGAYSTLDPATHALLFTLDMEHDRIRALKITTAEKTAIDAAITAAETDDANPEFEAATADHRARRRGSFRDPDGVATVVLGVDGQIPFVNAATEYVLATATLTVIGGPITAVTIRRERKQPWADLIVP